MEKGEIKVGLGVMIWKEGKVLLGKRVSEYGQGHYCFPGGRLEYNESLVDCAQREVREECGIEIDNIRFQLLDNIKGDTVHWVGIGFEADWKSGEPAVLEPQKLTDWQWYDMDKLPAPLFKPSERMAEAYKKQTNFIDD